MIQDVYDSERLPPAERFERWRAMAGASSVPMAMTSPHAADFTARARRLDLGLAQLVTMSYVPLEARRDERLVQRSDPEFFHLALTVHGRRLIEQGGEEAELRPGDLLLYDSSRPFASRVTASGPGLAETLMVQFPRELLPVESRDLRPLLVTPIPGNDGLAALLTRFLTGLPSGAGGYRAADARRLGAVTLDLIAALVDHELDSAAPPETHRQALVLRLEAFIEANLGDPGLRPGTIAAAHHISTRYLHRLFQEEGRTVVAWIRRQRLERCRRDLADPRLRGRPIHAIAARWGFSQATDFSRAFRVAYGTAPRDFRRMALSGSGYRPAAGRPSGDDGPPPRRSAEQR